MLLGKRHKKIVASTVAEIRGALPLVGEGLLEEVRTHKHRKITPQPVDTVLCSYY